MQKTTYPPGGVLFPVKNLSGPNSPAMTGNLEISNDVLDYLVGCRESGKPPKMDLAAWNKTSQSSGARFVSISASIPWSERQQQGSPRPAANRMPAAQPRRAYQPADDEEVPF